MNAPRNIPPARPGQTGTRVVKDLLRVGRWHVGDNQYVNFSNGDLQAIARRFREHQEAGITHPLAWGHVQPDRDDIDPQDVIAPISDVWVENGVLYFAAYVQKPAMLQLTDQMRQVSIGLLSNWQDGTGKKWPGYNLMHAGIVAHAVVTDQQPFIQLGIGRPRRSRQVSKLDIACGRAFLKTGKMPHIPDDWPGFRPRRTSGR